MAIKYVCDFCGQEAKTFHKEFSTGEIICDNCYEHLKNQTWRLAEEPAELEKAKESIRQESKKIESRRKELEKEQSMDKMMSSRYRNGFYAVIRLYNQIVKALYWIEKPAQRDGVSFGNLISICLERIIVNSLS